MPRIINLFYDWDPNCNGNITRAEFHRALTHLNFDASGATINTLFNLSDSNGDDVVSFRELQQVIYNSPPTVQDFQCKTLFDGAALATTLSTALVSTSAADISTSVDVSTSVEVSTVSAAISCSTAPSTSLPATLTPTALTTLMASTSLTPSLTTNPPPHAFTTASSISSATKPAAEPASPISSLNASTQTLLSGDEIGNALQAAERAMAAAEDARQEAITKVAAAETKVAAAEAEFRTKAAVAEAKVADVEAEYRAKLASTEARHVWQKGMSVAQRKAAEAEIVEARDEAARATARAQNVEADARRLEADARRLEAEARNEVEEAKRQQRLHMDEVRRLKVKVAEAEEAKVRERAQAEDAIAEAARSRRLEAEAVRQAEQGVEEAKRREREAAEKATREVLRSHEAIQTALQQVEAAQRAEASAERAERAARDAKADAERREREAYQRAADAARSSATQAETNAEALAEASTRTETLKAECAHHQRTMLDWKREKDALTRELGDVRVALDEKRNELAVAQDALYARTRSLEKAQRDAVTMARKLIHIAEWHAEPRGLSLDRSPRSLTLDSTAYDFASPMMSESMPQVAAAPVTAQTQHRTSSPPRPFTIAQPSPAYALSSQPTSSALHSPSHTSPSQQRPDLVNMRDEVAFPRQQPTVSWSPSPCLDALGSMQPGHSSVGVQASTPHRQLREHASLDSCLLPPPPRPHTRVCASLSAQQPGDSYIDPSTPKPLAQFLVCFQCTSKDAASSQRRGELFSRFSSGARGYLTLGEVYAGIQSLLVSHHGKEGAVVYQRYFRSYIRAYTCAKQAVHPRANRPAADGDFVTKSEFGFLLVYLGVYATLYEVFAYVIDVGRDRTGEVGDQDHRIARKEWNSAINKVRNAGSSWAPYLRLRNVSTFDFDVIDHNGGGVVDFRQFCLWIEAAEQASFDSGAVEPIDASHAFLSSPLPHIVSGSEERASDIIWRACGYHLSAGEAKARRGLRRAWCEASPTPLHLQFFG